MVIEAAIKGWVDMGILLGIQFTNASISFYETTKAGDAVAALKVGTISTRQRPASTYEAQAAPGARGSPCGVYVSGCVQASLKPLATVNRDGKWITMDAALVVPGDLVLLGAGGAVPADCLLNHGQVGRVKGHM